MSILTLLQQISSPRFRSGAGRQRVRRKAARSFLPRVHVLEDRTLLAWAAIGPAPILNGQTPGNQPVTGRLAAVAADPNDANTLYVAAAGGGVWKTMDSGASWNPLTDSQATLFMGALAVAPSNPHIIYAGTGEANFNFDGYYGRGVLKSTDGGATWTLLGTAQFDLKTISQIVVNPTNSDIVYLAVGGGGVNGLGGNTGVWKSTDGGLRWTNTTTAISTDQPYTALTFAGQDPTSNTLFTAVGNINGSDANGVYNTTDGGMTWNPVGPSFPSGMVDGRIDLAASPTGAMYASIAGSGQPGSSDKGDLFRVMRSNDGGATWNNITPTIDYMNPNDEGGQGWYDQTLAVDPNMPGRVYAGGSVTVLETSDSGQTWSDISMGTDGNGPHADHHGIAFDAMGRLLDGNDGGIWRLDNPNVGAIQWTDLNGNLQITQFTGIAQDPTNANILYGGSQDNGREKFTGGLAWNRTSDGDGGYMRIDPVNPMTVYGEFQNGSLERSTNGGATWVNISPPADGGNFYQPFVIDPTNNVNLLFGNKTLWKSINRGANWTAIGQDGMNGFNTGPKGSIDAVSTNGTAIYVSVTQRDTNDVVLGNPVFVTTDVSSASPMWTERDLPGTSATVPALLAVDVSFGFPGFAFAVHNRFGVGKIFFTFDYGVHWFDDTANLPAVGNDDLPAWSVAFDTTGGGNLYLGTDNGVYQGPGPFSWTTVGRASLPNVQVTGLELNAALNVLDAGTHGRGVFQLPLPPPPPGRLAPSGGGLAPTWRDLLALNPIPTATHAGLASSSRGALGRSSPFSAPAEPSAGYAISTYALLAASPAGFQLFSRGTPEWSAVFSAQVVPPAADNMPMHGLDVANLDTLFASQRAANDLVLSDTELAVRATNDLLTGDALLSDVVLLAAVLSPPLTV